VSFFVAVDLDAAVRAEVAQLVAQHSASTPAKWLPPEKLHVTLHYLGHPKAEALAALEPKLTAIARGQAPFALSLSGAGMFETRRAPAVLWLGVKGELARLASLQRAVAEAAGAVEERAFVPHLTLARGKSPGPLATVAEGLKGYASPPFVISGLTLYESKDHVFRTVFAVRFS
jgi:RNA 2',3'-cyclic 3'-phosphodiesterase